MVVLAAVVELRPLAPALAALAIRLAQARHKEARAVAETRTGLLTEMAEAVVVRLR